MDETILNKTLTKAEEFFGTAEDPDQIPICKESYYKLLKLHPEAAAYKLIENEPVSWSIVVPTSKVLADEFLSGKITERELLDLSQPAEKYEALYLCSVFTVPEHRNKGYGLETLKKAISNIPLTQQGKYFAWPYSPEGRKLLSKLEGDLKIEVELKA